MGLRAAVILFLTLMTMSVSGDGVSSLIEDLKAVSLPAEWVQAPAFKPGIFLILFGGIKKTDDSSLIIQKIEPSDRIKKLQQRFANQNELKSGTHLGHYLVTGKNTEGSFQCVDLKDGQNNKTSHQCWLFGEKQNFTLIIEGAIRPSEKIINRYKDLLMAEVRR